MCSEINAILVDDESHCIDNLRHYLEINCPRIKIVGTGEAAECAEHLLNNLQVDVAFLDIHLFDRNIFEWIASTKTTIPIVFVTAYEQYALPAFRVSALDYLLKPLETSEIRRCYNKVIDFFEGHLKPAPADEGTKKVTLRQGDHIFIVHLHDIVLLKANGFYTNVYFEHEGKLKMIVICKPISVICAEWKGPLLMRVHRSYTVNLKKIAAIRKTSSGVFLDTGGALVPLAKKRSIEFFDRYDM
jgi:two-component system LytT family response regulator